MKKGIIICLILFFGFALTGCKNRETDEFGEFYSTNKVDLEKALQNDKDMTSVHVEHYRNIRPYIDTYDEFNIEDNKYEDILRGIFYKLPNNDFSCLIQYDKDYSSDYIEHPEIYETTAVALTSKGFVSDKLTLDRFPFEYLEVEGDYFKYDVPGIEPDIFALIRVNSANYIDHFIMVSEVDNEREILEEHKLSGHNNTTVVIPESTYLTPVEYLMLELGESGFTFTENSDANFDFTFEDYSGTIYLDIAKALIVKGDDEFLYNIDSSYLELRNTFGEGDYGKLTQLIYINNQYNLGYYDRCYRE